MAATMAVTAIASLVLLSFSGWWVLLALIPLGIAVLAYNAAVQAALAYAETVHVAFDLHRADLLTALRMEPPRRQDAERALNEHWCDLWRQGIPLPATLEYTPATATNPQGKARSHFVIVLRLRRRQISAVLGVKPQSGSACSCAHNRSFCPYRRPSQTHRTPGRLQLGGARRGSSFVCGFAVLGGPYESRSRVNLPEGLAAFAASACPASSLP